MQVDPACLGQLGLGPAVLTRSRANGFLNMLGEATLLPGCGCVIDAHGPVPVQLLRWRVQECVHWVLICTQQPSHEQLPHAQSLWPAGALQRA